MNIIMASTKVQINCILKRYFDLGQPYDMPDCFSYPFWTVLMLQY